MPWGSCSTRRYASAARPVSAPASRPTTCHPRSAHVDALWDTPLDISGKTLTVIKVYKNGKPEQKDREKDGYAFVKKSCLHCVDPSCVSACPVKAMTKDERTGVVSYNKDACIGCRYCVAACPFGVPRFTYDRAIPQISKCQLCKHRWADGKYAACAEVCPTGATLFGKVTDIKEEITRRKALKPGTPTSFPRGRLGGPDQSYPAVASKYVEHVYGEKELGGTQMMMLSGVSLREARLPQAARHLVRGAVRDPAALALRRAGLAAGIPGRPDLGGQAQCEGG